MDKPRIGKTKRALILAALSERAAINSICRMFRVAKPSVLRFLRECALRRRLSHFGPWRR
jgi:transposase-like protein